MRQLSAFLCMLCAVLCACEGALAEVEWRYAGAEQVQLDEVHDLGGPTLTISGIARDPGVTHANIYFAEYFDFSALRDQIVLPEALSGAEMLIENKGGLWRLMEGEELIAGLSLSAGAISYYQHEDSDRALEGINAIWMRDGLNEETLMTYEKLAGVELDFMSIDEALDCVAAFLKDMPYSYVLCRDEAKVAGFSGELLRDFYGCASAVSCYQIEIPYQIDALPQYPLMFIWQQNHFYIATAGRILAHVTADGVVNLQSDSCFTQLQPIQEQVPLLSLEEAIQALADYYGGLLSMGSVRLRNAELVYLPLPTTAVTGEFSAYTDGVYLTPVWVFHQANANYLCPDFINAVTGEYIH